MRKLKALFATGGTHLKPFPGGWFRICGGQSAAAILLEFEILKFTVLVFTVVWSCDSE
jgi:hypothetical protein